MASLPDRPLAGVVALDRWRLEVVDQAFSAVAASSPRLNKWMPWAESMPTHEPTRAVLEAGVAACEAADEWQYVLREFASGAVVGCLGLHRRPWGWLELGDWVPSDRTGRGYATAAAAALTNPVLRILREVERVQI